MVTYEIFLPTDAGNFNVDNSEQLTISPQVVPINKNNLDNNLIAYNNISAFINTI